MKNFLFLLVLSFFFSCQSGVNYDVLITNATIYDGSGNSPIKGSVAINADTIAAIGEVKGKGVQTIDAKGMAVTPGFINMLSWATESLIEDSRG
ncbi:MAG: D-aminoacylase, partial [Saprospiraceae bacterium]|nr:D-aminoacylase [Saprospiraceae bacterium]